MPMVKIIRPCAVDGVYYAAADEVDVAESTAAKIVKLGHGVYMTTETYANISTLQQQLSNQAAQINTQALQIKSLDNKVSTLQVGAVNLLFDSEFANATNYLNRSEHSKSIINNRTVIRVKPTSPSGAVGIIHSNTSKKTVIEKDLTYTITLYARAYQEMPLNYIYLMRSESGGNAYLPRINITAEWQRYSITFVAPWNSATVSMLIGSNTTYTSDAWFEFHSVKLERGKIATDWTPSLADTQATINKIDNRITNLENKFANISDTV